ESKLSERTPSFGGAHNGSATTWRPSARRRPPWPTKRKKRNSKDGRLGLTYRPIAWIPSKNRRTALWMTSRKYCAVCGRSRGDGEGKPVRRGNGRVVAAKGPPVVKERHR